MKSSAAVVAAVQEYSKDGNRTKLMETLRLTEQMPLNFRHLLNYIAFIRDKFPQRTPQVCLDKKFCPFGDPVVWIGDRSILFNEPLTKANVLHCRVEALDSVYEYDVSARIPSLLRPVARRPESLGKLLDAFDGVAARVLAARHTPGVLGSIGFYLSKLEQFALAGECLQYRDNRVFYAQAEEDSAADIGLRRDTLHIRLIDPDDGEESPLDPHQTNNLAGTGGKR